MVFSYQRLKRFFSVNFYPPKEPPELKDNILDNSSCIQNEDKFKMFYIDNLDNDVTSNPELNYEKLSQVVKPLEHRFSYLLILPLLYLIIHVLFLLLVFGQKYTFEIKSSSDLELSSNKFGNYFSSTTSYNGQVIPTSKTSKLKPQYTVTSENLKKIADPIKIAKEKVNTPLKSNKDELFTEINNYLYNNPFLIIGKNTINYFMPTVLFNYFDLMTVNVELLFITSSLNSFIGLLILIIIFSILKQRFNVPEYKKKKINLYIMLCFGLLNISMSLIIGCYPFYLSNLTKKNVFGEYSESYLFDQIDSDSNISFKILFFMCFVLISILYNAFVISNVLILKRTFFENTKMKYKFFYKLIILVQISLLSTFFIVCLMQKNNLIVMNGTIFDNKVLFFLTPYLIYMLLGLMNFSFYFDMKYIIYRMSRNIEIDYLFEEDGDCHA